jgi:hypothetical protein
MEAMQRRLPTRLDDIGVSLREYVQTPLSIKLALVNDLEKIVEYRSNGVQGEDWLRMSLKTDGGG